MRAAARHQIPRHLLDLPAEVLQQIYESMSIISRHDHLSFLLTCRRILFESYASFLARPVLVKSQSQLIEFTKRRQQYHLSKITTLIFCLDDISRDAVRPYLTQAVMGLFKTTNLRPYHDELSRITSALSLLPKLTSISILRSSSPSHNSAPRFLASELLRWITHHLPKLSHLRIDYDTYSLSHLSHLPHLRTLRISGSSDTSPTQTLSTLTSLHHLVALHLIPTGYTQRAPFFKLPSPHLSITPYVVQHIRPLRALTLTEPPDSPSEHPQILTAEMLTAVALTHASSLRSFTVTSLHPLSESAGEVLVALLLSMSCLEEVRLEVPELGEAVLDALPGGVRKVSVLVGGRREAERVLGRLRGQRWRLAGLRRVVVLVVTGVDREGEQERGREREVSASSGWKVEAVEEVKVDQDETGVLRRRGMLAEEGEGVEDLAAGMPWAVRWGWWRPFSGGLDD